MREDIIIRIDRNRAELWSNVTRLMLIQLLHSLDQRPEMNSEEGKDIPPTLLLLDEFPQYGYMREFVQALKVLRSKNVTTALFCQSLADLDAVYGEDTSMEMLDNCPYKAILDNVVNKQGAK